jgi:hypothetical protein
MDLEPARQSSLSVLEVAQHKEKPGVITPSRSGGIKTVPLPPPTRSRGRRQRIAEEEKPKKESAEAGGSAAAGEREPVLKRVENDIEEPHTVEIAVPAPPPTRGWVRRKKKAEEEKRKKELAEEELRRQNMGESEQIDRETGEEDEVPPSAGVVINGVHRHEMDGHPDHDHQGAQAPEEVSVVPALHDFGAAAKGGPESGAGSSTTTPSTVNLSKRKQNVHFELREEVSSDAMGAHSGAAEEDGVESAAGETLPDLYMRVWISRPFEEDTEADSAMNSS